MQRKRFTVTSKEPKMYLSKQSEEFMLALTRSNSTWRSKHKLEHLPALTSGEFLIICIQLTQIQPYALEWCGKDGEGIDILFTM